METDTKTILTVKELSIGFETKQGLLQVTDRISFQLKTGEILGLVGESGSGKSVTALAIMGLLGQEAHILSGNIQFLGKDLVNYSQKEYEKIRGAELAMVFQEPMTSLNPVLTIGTQAEEMLRLHQGKENSNKRKEKVLELFEKTGLTQGELLYDKYPHQLSGGMRQRVMLATAMLCRPKLLIADEPTTALDVTLQAKILELIQKLNEEYHMAVLFISHDLGVIRKLCKRALVLHDGKCVEQGAVSELFSHPRKEYTKELLSASTGRDYKTNKTTGNSLFLSVKNLSVFYPKQAAKFWKKGTKKQAVEEVSFELYKGETLGIVGESGSGKSSLAKALAGLLPDCTGQVLYQGKEKLQPKMVFQDPYGSLNPSKSIGWLLEEPLRLLQPKKKDQKQYRRERAEQMLEKTGLPFEFYKRYPKALSGGQRQRVAIAIALMTNPKFLILDEPVSALDVTVQEQILGLLSKVREEFELTYLFISHDLSVVRRFCDRICVMYQGKIIESAKTEQLFKQPQTEYTKKLLDSML